jgi:glycosyltransferase involved in cell wall biosynthesis
VSSHGGAVEIVRDGIDGIVVDPLDSSALSGAIGRVLDDPDLAARLRSAGPPRAAEFAWNPIVERYRDRYARA